jgi:hypothetical protein
MQRVCNQPQPPEIPGGTIAPHLSENCRTDEQHFGVIGRSAPRFIHGFDGRTKRAPAQFGNGKVGRSKRLIGRLFR